MRTFSRALTLLLSTSLPLAIGMPLGLHGQNTVGLGASVVSATFTGDDIDISSRTAVGLSGWVVVPINERFNFVPGVAFAPKGWSSSDSFEDVTLKLNYLEFPLLISVPVAGEPGMLMFTVFGGPSLAFEISCKIDFQEANGPSGSDDCGGDDARKKFDVGALAGVGASYPATERVAVFGNQGVDFGLVNIDEDPDDTLRNRAFFVSVGASLPLGSGGG